MRRLVVEPPAAEAEAARSATPAERAAAREFGPRRRREYLAWRAVVRREVGADAAIAYDAVGAPQITNYPLFLSVSHCAGRVAVALSDRRCAVDVEPAGRNFSRVAPRCMTAAERALSDDPLWPGFVWCAKEALYKYAGRRGADLLRDLSVESADLEAGRLTGRIAGGEAVEVAVHCDEGFIVAAIFESL